jgi:hypothetical protein
VSPLPLPLLLLPLPLLLPLLLPLPLLLGRVGRDGGSTDAPRASLDTPRAQTRRA